MLMKLTGDIKDYPLKMHTDFHLIQVKKDKWQNYDPELLKCWSLWND